MHDLDIRSAEKLPLSLSQKAYKAEGKAYHFMPFLLASTTLNGTMDTH